MFMTWNASLLLFRHQMRKWFGNESSEALIQMEMEVNFMESYMQLDLSICQTQRKLIMYSVYADIQIWGKLNIFGHAVYIRSDWENICAYALIIHKCIFGNPIEINWFIKKNKRMCGYIRNTYAHIRMKPHGQL